MRYSPLIEDISPLDKGATYLPSQSSVTFQLDKLSEVLHVNLDVITKCCMLTSGSSP
jgi:hypothetical protein